VRRATLPKVLPPKPGRVIRRARVAEALLAAGESAAAWVQAPGGWGKTTAVAALAEDLKRPVAWLHLDAGDAQPEPFFHFLRLAVARAVPKAERSLPVYGAKDAAQAALHARNFARAALEAAGEGGAVLALDNLQDIPEDCGVHELVAALVEELTPAWRVFLVSRDAPGRAYLRLRGQGRLAGLAPTLLTFSRTELNQALRERGILDESRLEALANRSGGWIAGALLLAMHGGELAGASASEDDPAALFDYFAEQALARRTEGDRHLLARTAFLSTISPEGAARLSGLDDAVKRLDRLASEGVFTTKLATQPPRFRYHDLFRDYLRALAGDRHDPVELDALKRASAEELLALDDPLAALELLHECRAWGALEAAALRVADALLQRGQFRRLAEILRALPEERIEAEPWLRYWLGQCELHRDTESALVEFERAFRGFEARGERSAQLLAAIEMPTLLIVRNSPYDLREAWSERIERLAGVFDELPSTALRAKALAGLVSAIPHGTALLPRADELVRALLELLPEIDDPNASLQAASRIVMVAWRLRLPHLVVPAAAHVASRDLERRASPLIVVQWYYELITFEATFGDPAHGLVVAERMEAVAAATGSPDAAYDATLLHLEAACDGGQVALARELVARLEGQMNLQRPMSLTGVLAFKARIALLEGDAERALEGAREWIAARERAGAQASRYLAIAELEIGAHCAAGEFERALERCDDYLGTLASYARVSMETAAAWVRAARAVVREAPDARALLDVAAGLARARHDFLPLRYANALMARLCAKALDWDIEPAYVRVMIARRQLAPPRDATAAWPWPIRVNCLGRFELSRGQEALAERRGQKSVEMLQLAIALGGDQVPVDRIVKALWPGEGREGAQQVFDTTLHRLRKLLGFDDAIRVADKRLSIDRRVVWVDAFALEQSLTVLESADGNSVAACRAAVELYRGHFLAHRAGEGWADESRTRIWGRTRRAILAAVRAAQAGGDASLAERLLYFIVDLDPTAEDAMAEIMRLHLERGEAGEALRAFRRCEAALASELRVAPGTELQALAGRIRTQA
jgi:ATP/maltotriose-dependent transcriptional regulator MalT